MEMLKNFFGERIEKTVYISQEQIEDKTERNIYGRFFKDTQIFNVFPHEKGKSGKLLGKFVVNESDVDDKLQLCGLLADDKTEFYSYGKKINYETYNLYQNIFSRNKGILETGKMAQKRIVILGCGSVGS